MKLLNAENNKVIFKEEILNTIVNDGYINLKTESYFFFLELSYDDDILFRIYELNKTIYSQEENKIENFDNYILRNCISFDEEKNQIPDDFLEEILKNVKKV